MQIHLQKSIFFFLILMAPLSGPSQDNDPPRPFHTIENGDKSIPVYQWDEFSKFLNASDDTTYIFNFWATWCGPCVKEIPDFETVNKKLADQKVKVILVSLDLRSMWEKQLRDFVNERNLTSQVLVLYETDANLWIDKVDKDWSGAIPATLFVRQGKKAFHEGAMTREEITAYISKVK